MKWDLIMPGKGPSANRDFRSWIRSRVNRPAGGRKKKTSPIGNGSLRKGRPDSTSKHSPGTSQKRGARGSNIRVKRESVIYLEVRKSPVIRARERKGVPKRSDAFDRSNKCGA